MKRFAVAALAVLVGLGSFAGSASAEEVPAPAAPETSAVKFTPSGQYMLRFRTESRDKNDWTNDKYNVYFRHRARLGMKIEWKMLTAFVQLQDVRRWGSEASPLGDFSADGFDAHQAFLKVNLADGLDTTVGRQEIVFFNHRLIGNVIWIEQAQSFDALRLTYTGLDGKLFVDAFYAPLMNSLDSGTGKRADIVGLAAAYKVSPAFVPELTVIRDTSEIQQFSRLTAGLRVHGAVSGFKYDVEGYYQLGTQGPSDAEVDIGAFLAAVHARYTFDMAGKLFIEGFGEFLSGDDDTTDNKFKTFNTLHATNHKFYGEMDFFLNIPRDTDNKGLMDVGGAIGLSPYKKLKMSLVAHLFSAMEKRDGEAAFGTELDVKFSWKFNKHLKYDVFYGIFLPGAGLENGGHDDATAKHFVYSTVSGTF